MKRFEYKTCIGVIHIDQDRCENLKALNKLGMEGWEVVGVIDDVRLLLKREIQ